MALSNSEIIALKQQVRTLYPLTQARRQNLDTNVAGVTTNQPTGVDTGEDGGGIPYDVWRVADAVIDALAAEDETNTDVNVNAGNFATRFAAQVTAASNSNLTITRSGNNFSIAGLNDEGIQDIVGDMLNVTLGSSGITFSYNDTTGKLDIDFSGITSGGGGGTTLNAQGLVDLINNGEGNVDAALDTAGTKVALTGPTGGGGGTAGVVLDYRAVNASDISGNSTTITAAWVNKRNTFRGTSLSADHTVSMANGIGTANQVMQITNEDADNTITISGDIVSAPNNQDPVLQKFEWIILQKIGTGWKIVESGSLRTPSATMSGTPDNHEQVYGGHQASNDFSAWTYNDADVMHDVRTAGQTFMLQIPDVPNGDYYYFVFPNDRLPTMLVDGIGANRVTNFTTAARTIGSDSFTVYYRQNNSGIEAPVPYTITTA